MKEIVNWKDIEDYIEKVVEYYQDKELTGVYGLARGGLIFAVILSHKLHIPMLMAPIKNCLIVDDICDSGESLVHYQNNTSGNEENNYHITTMYYKENNLVKPELWYKGKEDKWIVYPWE